MKNYINYPFYYDDMPVDISFVFEEEKPAGKRGFLGVKKGDFYFEDGTLGRFWGVNINGGACFPDYEYSKKFAKRLAKTGINLVRFHQIDSEWNTPNIYSFTKGKRLKSTRSLDNVSMDRMDYLIYCLKEEGIYCYLDFFTYRKFKSGDGVENAALLGDAAKPYGCFSRKLIDLQKEAIEQIWRHYNSYTKLAYKDEPSFVMTEITNESDFFGWQDIVVQPYAGEFRKLLKDWADKTGVEIDAEKCDINAKDNDDLIRFKIYLLEKYYIEMMTHLRKTGVKIPIAGTNWTKIPALLKSQLVTDFTDSHLYFYDWRWGEKEKHCFNKALTEVQDTGFKDLLEMRVSGKPFFVSEWDMTWPNEYRAESSILYAAAGSLQGFGGFAIHTYSYNTRLSDMKMLGKEFSSNTIGNVPYREGVFSVWNDPAKYGLFYHAALIMRRGDVSPAKNTIEVEIGDLKKRPGNLETAGELSKIVMKFTDGLAKENPLGESLKSINGEVRSDTGELYRSWENRFGYIDTAMTKAAYGFLAENKHIKLNGLAVKCRSDFAVIALSSLTGDCIRGSDNILLTTVGRAVNTGAKFSGDLMLDYGSAPVKVEVIEAEIQLLTDNENMLVRAVNAEGYITGTVPSAYADGILSFTLGQTMPSIYYLIQAE